MDRIDCPVPVMPKGAETMDKTIAKRIVEEAFNFLEARAQGRLFLLAALHLVEQMALAAIDAGLLDYLRQKDALRDISNNPQGQPLPADSPNVPSGAMPGAK